jgi:2',3'-cyclic-nucleotide 2'-phosphodiesterase (5'-nucleotidase family)
MFQKLTLTHHAPPLFSFLFVKIFLIALPFICNFYPVVHAQNKNYNLHYELIKMDTTFDKNADLTLETYINHLKQEKDKKMGQIIGTSKEILTSFAPSSPLSNLFVDMLFDWGKNYLSQKKMPNVDLALLNFGGIRATLPQGDITIGDIYQIAPFDNTVAFVFAKGSELKKMFDAFTEKRNAPMANVQTKYQNGRLLSFTIGDTHLEDDKIYTIVTINFLALGGDHLLSQVAYESVLYLEISLRDIFIAEIRKRAMQGIEIESRMDSRVIIEPTP